MIATVGRQAGGRGIPGARVVAVVFEVALDLRRRQRDIGNTNLIQAGRRAVAVYVMAVGVLRVFENTWGPTLSAVVGHPVLAGRLPVLVEVGILPVKRGDVLVPLAIRDDAQASRTTASGSPAFVVEKFIIMTPAWVFPQFDLPGVQSQAS